MTYAMDFSREAVRDTDHVPEALRPAVGLALKALAADPLLEASEESATGGLRQLQIHECRVLYEVDEEERIITVWGIEHVNREGRFEKVSVAEGFDFVVKGRPRRATRQRVIEAMREVPPDSPTPWMVEVEDTLYPVLQAFFETFGIRHASMTSERAARIFERLGFLISKQPVKATRRRPKVAPPLARIIPYYRMERKGQDLLHEVIEVPPLLLHWSYPWRWDEIAQATEDSPDIDLPPEAPGVYDVRGKGRYESLYIGQSTDLLRRVYYGLVKGLLPHTAGEKIRENEDTADLSVRWAYTDRPAAVEEDLNLRHIETLGYPPTYAARR